MPEQKQIYELEEEDSLALEAELAAHKVEAERANLNCRVFVVTLILLGIAIANLANQEGYCQTSNWPPILQSCDTGEGSATRRSISLHKPPADDLMAPKAATTAIADVERSTGSGNSKAGSRYRPPGASVPR